MEGCKFLLNRTRRILASFSAVAVITVFALGITATAQGDDPPHVVFVTSASGTGDLGSWPEADPGTSGIEAGDSICRNLATTAGLPLPESFRAWLSDDATHAIDRFVEPGPWVRTDGVVVFRSPGALATSDLFTALNVTETGTYTDGTRAWTGTLRTGMAAADRCNNWHDGSDGSNGQVGLPVIVTLGWTANLIGSCDYDFRLYCLALEEAYMGEKLTMITAAAHTGGLDNTTWQTDLDLYNPGTTDVTATFSLPMGHLGNLFLV